jgi:phage I-like protein
MNLRAIHHQPFPGTVMGTAPEWVQLIPAGTFTGVDGRGPYTLKNPAAVIAASMQAAGGRMPIDENHATDLAGPNGEPSPAKAWIVALEARADGIWGRVEWTGPGTQLMADKAYSGISPVFTHDESGTVLLLKRAALTNAPNLSQLAKLFSQQETGLNLAEQLRAALGLPATADDAAIVTAATAAHAAVAAHSQQIAAIATAAGVTETDINGERLVTVLQRANAGDSARMASTIVELQTQLQTMVAQTGRERAERFVDGQIEAGKPIKPLRDHYVARHVADPAAVEKELNALTSINSGGLPPNKGKTPEQMSDDGDMTAEEMAVCEKFGTDPKAYKEHKAKMAAKKKGV